MITVGLVQIAELNWQHRQRQQHCFHDGVLVPKQIDAVVPATEYVYLPLSVGLLQAYAQRHARSPADFRFLPPIYRRIAVAQAVEALLAADIVGFSTYVWNINLSLRIAAELKRRRPDTLIVFGGPQVPDNPEDFLRAHRHVDLAIHGEGEQVFLEILERVEQRSFGDVPSLSYIAPSGELVRTARAPRARDLAALPSPYTDGVFDPLISANPAKKWLVMWETNRGCPFSCSFCDWGSAVGAKVNRFDFGRLAAEVDWFVANKVTHLFICDANFGILPRDREIAEMLVERYEAAGLPVAISIQNSKNATERSFQIQRIFSASKLVHFGATLSLQSVSKDALEAIKRDNISLESFHDLHTRFRDAGVETYTDMIVGLPGETYDSFADGLDEVIDRGQHNRVAFYNCSVLPNAEMGDAAYQQRHGIEYVPVPIVHEHEGLDRRDRDEATEYLNTIVATRTMDRADWVRTRVFAWAVDCLHFNRVLQVAAIAMRRLCGLRYRALYQAILDADAERYPVCAGLAAIFTAQALRIQRGEPEYIPSSEWLNVWWPADQYALIHLVRGRKIDAFYREVADLLAEWLKRRGKHDQVGLAREAVALSRALLRQPKEFEDLDLALSCDLHGFVTDVIAGRPAELDRTPTRYRIDRSSTVWVTRDAWCEDVLVQYYRRADFSYPIRRLEPAIGASAPPARAAAEQRALVL
ncbi:MAG: radical SAM protein [Alphaproteobacteria bacterium]|nr:MAG: radical SAM protein [Alphaproteobacteria bacterium]